MMMPPTVMETAGRLLLLVVVVVCYQFAEIHLHASMAAASAVHR